FRTCPGDCLPSAVIVIFIRATPTIGGSHDHAYVTQAKLGRAALRVSGSFLDRPLERNNGRVEGRL
ncbi:MAG TPA: hypothetical protein VFZ07_07330, partial [Dongiaceae bacterium]